MHAHTHAHPQHAHIGFVTSGQLGIPALLLVSFMCRLGKLLNSSPPSSIVR